MAGTPVLQGNLSFISLSDLFQLLGGNSSTGILHLSCPYAPSSALVYFRDGDPINASNGKARGVAALNPLFGWQEGVFAFHRGPVQAQRAIKKSRMQIMLDALRLVDEGTIEKVGPPAGGREDDQSRKPKGKGTILWKSMPVIKGPMVDYLYVVEEEEFTSGHRVVTEGRHGNWIWIVLEGEVEVLRDTPKGLITIARLGTGSFIGTFMIFLFEGSIRSAHVNALGNVRLGLLDTQRLYGEFAKLSADFRNLLLSLSRRLIKTSDRIVDLYCGTRKSPASVQGKDPFMKIGDPRKEAYLITSGEVTLVTQAGKAGFPLLSLEREDVFGNLSFAGTGQEPFAASVFASKGLEVEKLDPARLQEDHARLSTTFRGLLETLCTSLSVTTQVASHLAGRKKP